MRLVREALQEPDRCSSEDDDSESTNFSLSDSNSTSRLQCLLQGLRTQLSRPGMPSDWFHSARFCANLSSAVMEVLDGRDGETTSTNSEQGGSNSHACSTRNVTNIDIIPHLLPWLTASKTAATSALVDRLLNIVLNNTSKNDLNTTFYALLSVIVERPSDVRFIEAVARLGTHHDSQQQGSSLAPIANAIDEEESGRRLDLLRRVVLQVSDQHMAASVVGQTKVNSDDTKSKEKVKQLRQRFHRRIAEEITTSSTGRFNDRTRSALLSVLVALVQRASADSATMALLKHWLHQNRLHFLSSSSGRRSRQGPVSASFLSSKNNTRKNLVTHNFDSMKMEDTLKLAFFCASADYLEDGILVSCLERAIQGRMFLTEAQRRLLNTVVGTLRAEHTLWFSKHVPVKMQSALGEAGGVH
ncbi:unnamed protein product [Amoebophrya sp. A25]|nr:unnamed protein product [Amoebophrya sp. A25]|eukprot:GSA25T00018610001.1